MNHAVSNLGEGKGLTEADRQYLQIVIGGEIHEVDIEMEEIVYRAIVKVSS